MYELMLVTFENNQKDGCYHQDIFGQIKNEF